jgi:hypothetical protein
VIARRILGFSLAAVALLGLISSLVAWYFGSPPQWAGVPVGEFVRLHAPFQFEFWRQAIADRYVWVCDIARLASLVAIAFCAIRCWMEIEKQKASKIDDFGADRWASKSDIKRKDLV